MEKNDFCLGDYKTVRELRGYDIVVPRTFVEGCERDQVLFAGCFKSFCVLSSGLGLVSFAPTWDIDEEINKVVHNFDKLLFLPIGRLEDVNKEQQTKISDFVIIGGKKWRIVGWKKMLGDVTYVYRTDLVFPFVHVRKLELKNIL